MTTFNTQLNMVRDLRTIRDQISNEIKDMNFEEERAYLDKLLDDGEKSMFNKRSQQLEVPKKDQEKVKKAK
ncbi:MAG: hypothetical protein ABIO05_06030 [Ferruginibacter sp.]